MSSRGRIERHGAYRLYRGSGRSRELRREPVRGAACQSEMQQLGWCSGTHRVAWRSTMPETVALAILRFGSRCNRAIWINSHCRERSHLGRVAKGLGALARGPNQASVQRPGVSDLWLSPLCYCSDSGQRNSLGLNAQPGAPARAGVRHGACNAQQCSPRLAQMRPSSQPTVHRLLKKHSDECGTGNTWQAQGRLVMTQL